MNYNTEILSPTDENIEKAGRLLKSGEVVGIPTETVYGLAADATDPDAVSKIFVAKGRPQDNPLIVHISEVEDMEKYARDIPDVAYRLAEKFWPGPLT
ncbi:MAG: L-threonylcarbamoyladenylate synthase, partial [Oscillospiraceae bacterium]|nr:L-threonylcarbamoyladenylate synthase [Oscillospiraceae bacterium]